MESPSTSFLIENQLSIYHRVDNSTNSYQRIIHSNEKFKENLSMLLLLSPFIECWGH